MPEPTTPAPPTAPEPDVCGFRHDQWDGPYNMRRRCTAPAGHATGQFAYDHGPWEAVPADAPADLGAPAASPNETGGGVAPCHCGLGTTADCATQPWGCGPNGDHACGNCEGIDPRSCVMNPGRTAAIPNVHPTSEPYAYQPSSAFTWAESVASTGTGPTARIDIDIHAPGHDEPVPVAIPLGQARNLHAMLGDLLGEHGVLTDIGTEFVQQADNPDWDAIERAEAAYPTAPSAGRDAGHLEHAAARSSKPAVGLNEAMRLQVFGIALDNLIRFKDSSLHPSTVAVDLADAVLAVRDDEMQQLRAELDAERGSLPRWLRRLSTEHQRAEEAEAKVARVQETCGRLQRASVLADGQPHTDREHGVVQAVDRIRTALTAPTGPAEQGDGGGK